MVELTLKIDDIDYDGLAELLLPALIEQAEKNSLTKFFVRSPEAAKGTALGLLSRMSQKSRDEFLTKYINGSSRKAAEALEKMAAKNGVSISVKGVSAKSL